MNSLTLNHEYTKIMMEATQTVNRTDAINLIQRATKIREALEVAKQLEKR